MPFPTPTTRKYGTPLLRGLALLLVAALVINTASAQALSRLLPQETFVVIGFTGVGEHEAKFQPFVNEWERLGLTDLLSQAFAEMDDEDADSEELLPAEFEGLGLFDFIGDEAWLALSASRSNPLPSVSLVARVSDAAAAALQELWNRESAGQQVLTEGNIRFSVDDAASDPVAVALDGNFLAVSTNPDVLRGLLRRYQGAAEPNFHDSLSYSASIAPLLPGNALFHFDLDRVVDLVQPLTAGMGFDASVSRLAKVLRTIGSYTSVTRITDAGYESNSRHVFGDPSLDPELYGLLNTNIPASSSAMAFVDGSAVSYQASGWNPAGWWRYLSNLVGDLPELGVGPLDAFVRDNLGLDLSQLLFDWMGSTFALVTPFGQVTEIGMAPDNLLGDSLYLIETTDPAAATAGLKTIIEMGSMVAGQFMDPYGEGGGAVAPAQRTVAGVTVDSYDVGEGIAIEIAVANGYVIIATSSTAMNAALQASAAGGALPSTLASLTGDVPADAATVLLQDGAASFRMMGQMLTSQFGLYSGLLASDLDFDAAEAASDALGQYIEFLASRSGGQYSYSRVSNGVSVGYSLTSVNW